MRNFIKPLRFAFFAATLAFATPALNAAAILVDFGSPLQGPAGGKTWNGISDAVAGSVINALDADTGLGTGINLNITSRFNATNSNGATGSTVFPGPADAATGDSFYGNALLPFGGQPVIASATVEFTGLNLGLAYNFTFYAARIGAGGDNRTTRYTLTGLGAPTFAELNASENVNGSALISGVRPDAAGKISLLVAPGTGNNNSTGFFYLGALQAVSVAVPEPGTAVLLLGAVPLLALRRRR